MTIKVDEVAVGHRRKKEKRRRRGEDTHTRVLLVEFIYNHQGITKTAHTFLLLSL